MKNLIIVASLIFCCAAQPNKPVWPTQFDAAFGMSAPAITNTITPIVNATSHFYYKWDQIQSTLIDYEVNCIPGVGKVIHLAEN
jgi:hypothetical protein